ncbi:MAG: NAD(P)H-hydrate dehydratase, partial [Rhodovibrionaceae bacterium]
IPDAELDEIGPRLWENRPDLWQAQYPRRSASGHKYRHGHALIAGGSEMTGAGRLASRSALRCGAGLVTVAAPRAALLAYQLESPSLLATACEDENAWQGLLADTRRNALLLGPGGGVGPEMRKWVLSSLATGRATVLDADALTSFADDPASLFDAIAGPCVLTPHEGEFARLFPDLEGDKLARARAAAQGSGAVVLLKGADSVIAAPDGRAAINANAPPELATAGAGDVLAGMILAYLAQGTDPFEAACMAAWLHGDAAARFGAGLISEDLPELLPAAQQALFALLSDSRNST